MRKSVFVFVLAAFCSAAAQTGCISVMVTDYKGLPLANLHAVVSRGYSGEYWSRDTDDKGRFDVTGMLPGNYTVTLRNYALGYEDTNNSDFTEVFPQPHYAVTESSKCTEVNVQREPPVARLHLKLTDEDSGKFIEEPEAQFRRTDGHHAWNASTKRQLDLLVPPLKPIEILVGAKGYRTTAPFSIPPLQPGEVRDFDAVLKPIGLGCLQGRVLDADAQPVIAIKVQPLLINDSLNSKAFSINTNQDGEFEMMNLPVGTYYVFVHSKDMGYDSNSTVSTDGKPFQVEVPASKACSEATLTVAQPNGKLMVDVIDAETYGPLEHFRFEVKSTVPRWWWSEGREWIKEMQIPPGRQCSVQAEAEGYQTSEPMPLAPFASGEARKITIALRKL
jgi:hypothetical protein